MFARPGRSGHGQTPCVRIRVVDTALGAADIRRRANRRAGRIAGAAPRRTAIHKVPHDEPDHQSEGFGHPDRRFELLCADDQPQHAARLWSQQGSGGRADDRPAANAVRTEDRYPAVRRAPAAARRAGAHAHHPPQCGQREPHDADPADVERYARDHDQERARRRREHGDCKADVAEEPLRPAGVDCVQLPQFRRHRNLFRPGPALQDRRLSGRRRPPQRGRRASRSARRPGRRSRKTISTAFSAPPAPDSPMAEQSEPRPQHISRRYPLSATGPPPGRRRRAKAPSRAPSARSRT